jgi:hypothetical protein
LAVTFSIDSIPRLLAASFYMQEARTNEILKGNVIFVTGRLCLKSQKSYPTGKTVKKTFTVLPR